jgi:hypothetical protein
MKRLLTGLNALGRLIAALFTRQPVFVTPDQSNTRIFICEIPCRHFDSADRKCSECGCYVDAKAMLATEDCPRGCWPKLK